MTQESQDDKNKSDFTCSVCKQVKSSKKLPRGWRRQSDNALQCDACWSSGFVLRSVVLPVRSVTQGWTALYGALTPAFRAAAIFSNQCMRAMLLAEPLRTSASTKLGPFPKVDTYGIYRDNKESFQELSSGTAAALEHAAQDKYRECRLAVVGFMKQALPTFRNPMPLPIRAQDWKLTKNDSQRYMVSVPIGAGSPRFDLMLAGGREFQRQIAVLEQILSGSARAAAISLYPVSGSSGDHRKRISTAKPGGGNQRLRKLMCRVVAYVPRLANEGRTAVLTVTTGPDALVTMRVHGSSEILKFHGDHLRRWVAEHDKRLQHSADDMKFERRGNFQRVNQPFLDLRHTWETKFRRRIDSLTHECSAMIAGYAARQKCAKVVYDARDKSFVAHFAWSELETKLAYKLANLGIVLELASGSSSLEGPGSAREAE